MRMVNLHAQVVGVNVLSYTYTERYYTSGIQTHRDNYVSTFLPGEKIIHATPQNVRNRFTKNVPFLFKKILNPYP